MPVGLKNANINLAIMAKMAKYDQPETGMINLPGKNLKDSACLLNQLGCFGENKFQNLSQGLHSMVFTFRRQNINDTQQNTAH